MAWDVRRGRRYYYRSARSEDHVRRVYLGGGELAELAARADEQRRAERRSQAEAWRDEETRREAAGVILDELGELTELLTRAALMGAGYHRHDRGPWRRRRDGSEGRRNRDGT
jgi:hypothetical protein